MSAAKDRDRAETHTGLGRWVAIGLALTLAYYLASAVGHLVAEPMGGLRLFWPATGVAMSALILRGPGLWPWVGLGSFLFSMIDLGGPRDWSEREWLVAAALACGAAIQAVIGAWMVRARLRVRDSIESGGELAIAMLLAGPVACVVGPSVSIAVALATGSSDEAHYLYAWWMVWLGDVTGVLLVLPLAVILTSPMRRPWSARAVCVAGIAASLGAWRIAEVYQEESQHEVFRQEAAECTRQVQQEVERTAEVLYAIRSFFLGSQEVTREEFATFVEPFTRRHRSLQAVTWSPRTTGDPAARSAAELDSGEQAPVQFVEPLTGNEPLIGSDLLKDPYFGPSLEMARDTGALIASRRMKLIHDAQARPAVALVLPIYRGAAGPQTLLERRERLWGYASAAFFVPQLVEAAFEPLTPPNIDVSLFDESAPPDEQRLFTRSVSSSIDPTGLALLAQAHDRPVGLYRSAGIDVGDRKWRVVCTPTDEWAVQHRSWTPLGLMVFGLLMTALISRYLAMVADRSAAVEHANARLLAAATRQQESERRLRDLYNNMPDMYAAIDAESGNLIDCNSTLLAALGYARDDIVGRHVLALYHEDSASEALATLARFRAFGDVRNAELILRRRDGTPIDAVLNMTAVHDASGHIIRGRAIWRDITELKLARAELEFQHAQLMEVFDQRTAELVRANAELERGNRKLTELYETAHKFVDNVSHEFRTPLTVIKGYTDVMIRGLGGELTAEQKEWMGLVSDRTRDLSQMVDDLLDTSRLRAGMLRVDRRTVEVSGILDRVWPVLATKAQSNRIILERRMEPGLPPVYADAEKAGRVVINLVVNAVKFSPEGSVVVVWADRAADGSVEVGVTDSGPGIGPEHLGVIFERFQQLGDPHRSSTKGFGLGLNIAKELAALNLGRMNVTSKPGQGSTFSFTLPVSDPSQIIGHYLLRLADYHPPGLELAFYEVAAGELVGREEELCALLATQSQPMDLLLPGHAGSGTALLLRVADDPWKMAEVLRATMAPRQDPLAGPQDKPSAPRGPAYAFRLLKAWPRSSDTPHRDAVTSFVVGVLGDAQAHAGRG